jgi:hypothetical protein
MPLDLGKVGQGVINRMNANQDEPLTEEMFQHSPAEVAAHGYQWSKTWGKKGLYIASNASGNWETVGPFGSPEE